MTNSEQLMGKWHEMKGKVKQRWAKLTDDDVEAISGRVEELAGKIQYHYGTTKEDTDKAIQDFRAKL